MYKIWVFWFDFNEIGFIMEDVEVICSMGNSLKIWSLSICIGWKGIGFKFVFKVVELVYIVFGCYFFRFDFRESFGMMILVWLMFLEECIVGWILFFFYFFFECDVSEIF